MSFENLLLQPLQAIVVMAIAAIAVVKEKVIQTAVIAEVAAAQQLQL